MTPVILGMNDPSGTEPLSPRDGAGARLAALAILAGLTARQYEIGFERRNLLEAKRWDSVRAGERARKIIPFLRGREVIVLGRAVWDAVLPLHDDKVFFDECVWQGVTWHLIPHPSGRNLAYNDPKVRNQAARVLREVHERSRK